MFSKDFMSLLYAIVLGGLEIWIMLTILEWLRVLL